MHPQAIVEKNARSQERISALAETISAALDIDHSIEFFPTARDPRVANLKQKEAIADFLELVVAALSKPEISIDPTPDPEPKPKRSKKE